KLISATPSPYARKVRIALAEKSIPFELLTEVPWNDDTSLPQFNPLEKLPVLILDDGSTVYESSYILEWLERKYPAPPLLPSDDDGILAAKRCLVLADGVCDAFLLVFFERRRPPEHQSAPWIARQMRKIEGGIAELARLTAGRDHAVGERFTLGDIGIGCVLGYFEVRFPEFDWRARHPDLARYFAKLMARDSFRTTLPYPQRIRDPVV
ncbi:MAG: glutathione S-transferase N-terminal domain-containing protein, partial [Rhodospirillales bacterium]|nr:glutathione S-transferase N-terminal domain-containing protein [Rhodospirillales bacterium]